MIFFSSIPMHARAHRPDINTYRTSVLSISKIFIDSFQSRTLRVEASSCYIYSGLSGLERENGLVSHSKNFIPK